jgi:hypothetical protein
MPRLERLQAALDHRQPDRTPDDVYREIRKRVEAFNRDGGFVFNAVHNIQGNTPVENVEALFRTLLESVHEHAPRNGTYRIPDAHLPRRRSRGLRFGYDKAAIAGAIGFPREHFRLAAAMKGRAASVRGRLAGEGPDLNLQPLGSDSRLGRGPCG